MIILGFKTIETLGSLGTHVRNVKINCRWLVPLYNIFIRFKIKFGADFPPVYWLFLPSVVFHKLEVKFCFHNIRN